uniref:C3H1-type domain-containing protein n=1 Tax=Moniliophthora roreri TaxID=221103 RepID=A0A0W0G4H7_MONRR
MSSPRRGRACKFYPQGRCRDGDRCRFSHDGAPPSNLQQRGAAHPRGGPRASPTPQSSRASPTPQSSRASPTPQPSRASPAPRSSRAFPGSAQPGGSGRAPRGNCDFFWNSGQCTRGFECTFRHVQQTAHSSNADQPPSAPENRDTLDFTSVEGLADMNDILQETQYQSTPVEAHNSIKRFTRDNFSFSNSNGSGVQDMVAFVKVLASVDRRNTSWNSDNAQAFLEMIVKGRGLDRICEILRHTQFLASDLILKSTLHHNINALYTALNDTFENVYDVLTRCMDGMISSRSWKDSTPGLPPSLSSNLSGVVIFETISTVLRQFFLRFKRTILHHSEFVQLVDKLATWFDTWCDARAQDPFAFDDHLESGLRKLTEAEMRRNIGRLQEIVRREHATIEAKRKPVQPTSLTTSDKNQALLARLWQTYDPPGNLRESGLPRHDNDAVNIADIRIIPTHQELLSDTRPYLPFNTDFPGVPHHCAEGSMEKHLDIQFRLLREELIAPMRESISVLQEDFHTIAARQRTRNQPPPQLTQIEEVIRRKGGMYRTSGRNSVLFQVYTNVEFSPLEAQRRGFTVGLVIDSPAGDARHADYKRRQEYWKRSKRLASGSLVGLVIVQNNQLHVSLGNISSSNTEIAESARLYDDRVEIRVQFFDPEVEMKALRREKVSAGDSSIAVLIDNGIMFESLRPFLETLQSMEPTSIPFHNFISQKSQLDSVELQPPRYATTPRFRFNLECVAKDGEYIHPLNATDPQSILRARRQLVDSSGLDPSQCQAMVDALTREVALIQGPPGTGKSFTGKEILRVLFANSIKPVVLIAFTNHALDHMLRSVLDAKITEGFVRIGSRSNDERISEYTLDKLERQSEGLSLDRSVGHAYREMKELEEKMREILYSIQLPQVSWTDIRIHLEDFWSDHLTSFLQPPFWIDELSKQALGDPEGEETSKWTTVERKQRKSQRNVTIDSIYSFWKHSQDIQFIRPPAAPDPNRRRERRRGQRAGDSDQQDSQELLNYRKRMETFFGPLGYGDSVPPIPEGLRGTSELLQCSNVWSLSSDERLGLATFWEEAIRSVAYSANLTEYNTLRKEYECACKKYNDIRDETRRRLLSRTDLIGCTTNGAAKLTSLLTTVAPKVLLVEEAGQVLEAHILSSLVPSVQHLICIGDPQQLRPNLANYNLSMDSDRGKELYKFDRSLMERLADNGFPMSQINVQRRMRPSISHHIRNILYPRLEDHDRVASYPPVKGMQQDVFFFTHMNKENGAEDSVSKSNAFEVRMIVELVKYFLKQDAYSAPGDIAVLCAYLGQLQKVRSALKDLRISVSLDERDANDLVRQGMEDESSIEEVVVSRHIRLGTVDVFQGDEAKIVIVSLVRNSGTFEADGAPIGFLKSSNRINVALSRAQHGMYIFGNAANLRQNETWRVIIDEMEQKEQLGFALPIVCPRHPDQVSMITQPHELSRQAPEGHSIPFTLDYHV